MRYSYIVLNRDQLMSIASSEVKYINTLSYWLWLAITVSSILSNHFYFISPTYSALNIFSVILSPYLIYSLWKRGVNLAGLFFFLGLALMLILTVIVAVTSPSEYAFREIRNVWTTIYFSLLAVFIIARFNFAARYIAVVSFLMLFFIGMLQLSHEIFGVGLEPLLDNSFTQYDQRGLQVGVSSVFGNPNNFSAFSLAFFVYILSSRRTRKRGGNLLLLACTGLAIFVSGSRSAFLLFVLGLLIVSWSSRVMVLVALLTAIFLVFPFLSSNTFTEIYIVDRFLSDIYLFSHGNQVGDSLSIRSGSYYFFLQNFPRFIFGSFSFYPVCPQFSNTNFDTSLIMINPHSLLIQINCAFGFFGFIISLLFITALCVTLFRNRVDFIMFTYIVFTFVVISSIPSWFLASSQIVFFLVLASLNHSNKTEENG
jgi:hypothetical protein